MIYTLRVGGRDYYVRYKGDFRKFKERLETRNQNDFIEAVVSIHSNDRALVRVASIDSVILEDIIQELTKDN